MAKAGALNLVVVAAGIVGDVVVVEGEAEEGLVVLGGGEEVEAEGEVVEGVEVPLGFGVARFEFPPGVAVGVLRLEEGEGLGEVLREIGHEGSVLMTSNQLRRKHPEQPPSDYSCGVAS